MRARGFTLIDVLVGSALVAVVFLGVFGVYRFGLRVLEQYQHRTVATALANEYMERARNLPYGNVGVQGGYPAGVFPLEETVVRNGFSYTIRPDVSYMADAADGLAAPDDACINDYKRVLFQVSWERTYPGEVRLVSDVVPKNEVEECEDQGGILRTRVFDALGSTVAAAQVQVRDVEGSLEDLCLTNAQGTCQLLLPASSPGASENYKMTVAKSGYSGAETFRSGDVYEGQTIATPETPHATVFEGQITEKSFAIDLLSAFQVTTATPPPELVGYWSFDEGSGQTAFDGSGNGNHGTLGFTSASEQSDPTWVLSQQGFGNALDFVDNVHNDSDHVRIPASASLDITNAVTIAMWINHGGLGGTHFMIWKKGAYTFMIGDDHKMNLILEGTSNPGVSACPEGHCSLTNLQGLGGSWHHIAVTWDGQDIRFYVDGVLDGVSQTDGLIETSNAIVEIGACEGGACDRWYKGKIDEVFLFNQALSPAQIADLMNRKIPGISLPFVPLEVKGTKVVGRDAAEQGILKYAKGHTTDGAGQKAIAELEWDSYTLSPDPAAGLDLLFTSPGPQPVALNPNTTQEVVLYLGSVHSLFLTVQDSADGEPVFAASVRLAKSGYDTTRFTDQNGKAVFSPLEGATYTMEVSAEGYEDFSDVVSVSGKTSRVVSLVRIEN